MRRLFIFLACLCFFSASFAESVVWGEQDHMLSIAENVYILEDELGEFTIEQVSSKEFQDKFKCPGQKTINFGYTESFHWIKFKLENSTEEELLLEIAHAFLPIADLYYKEDSSNRFTVISGGYNVNMSNKGVLNHLQVYKLPKGVEEFYVRVLSNSHPLPISVQDAKNYEISASKHRLVYGFYLGFMCFVIISNIFFAISLRNRLYLFYAIVVFVYACYAGLVMDGFFLYLFPKLDLMFWYVTVPCIGVIAQTAYCLVFLDTKKHVPKLNKAVLGVIAYFVIYLIAKNFMPLTAVLTFNTVHALMSFFIMATVGIVVGKKGNRMGYYYASTYSIYFIMVFIEAKYIQTGSPTYIFGLSHVAVATLIEAFLLSFLLSKRFEWEKAEVEKAKQAAQEKFLKSVQENEQIMINQNIVLEEEVAKRTEKLEGVNKELEVVIATKDRFFSIIAHDLKAPFNSMLGFSNILVEDFAELTEKEHVSYLKIINDGLNNTYKLLNNLLNWFHLQRGSIDYGPEKVNLYLVVNETIKLLDQQAHNKLISIHNRIPQEIYVKADNNMLLTILRNLVSNAIKYTNTGGLVEVMVEFRQNEKDENIAVISIVDNGVGIETHRLKSIFSVTDSNSTVGTEKELGTGLGLILCKDFIEKHNCQIWVESEYGKGSSFSFTMAAAEVF